MDVTNVDAVPHSESDICLRGAAQSVKGREQAAVTEQRVVNPISEEHGADAGNVFAGLSVSRDEPGAAQRMQED